MFQAASCALKTKSSVQCYAFHSLAPYKYNLPAVNCFSYHSELKGEAQKAGSEGFTSREKIRTRTKVESESEENSCRVDGKQKCDIFTVEVKPNENSTRSN